MANVKARPVSRQEIEKLLVTDADAFTALRYLRHRELVPSLPDLEEKGQKTLPGVEGSLCDLYHALWNPEPSVRAEVGADRRYWRELLGQTLKTSVYEELHGACQLKELQSVLGTIAMGEGVLAMVPEQDRKQLQGLAAAQQQASASAEASADKQAQAQAAQQLAEAAAQSAGSPSSQPSPTGGEGEGEGGQPSEGQPQPTQGSPQGQPGGGAGQMTPEQAKAIANELAKQAAQAKADADNLQKQAEEAKAKAEALADALLGKPGSEQAEQKLRELARIGLQAARDARAKVEEVSSTIQAWGLEEGELSRQSIPEALGLLERMKKSPHLKKFAALLGRIRKIAARKARSKASGEGARVTVPETGRDLKRVQRSELVALTSPALRVKALLRWARGELRLHGQKARQKLGHGPVIVCEDGSGSMEGAKQQWAKAVVLSLAHYAKLQRRSFGWVLFDSSVRLSRTYPHGRIGPEQMLELVEASAGGGTDFERPLRCALEMMQKEGLKNADICFITDGECAVSSAFVREFRAAKIALEFNVITVLCDVGASADAAVREFSDRIETASSFTAEEAEQKVFGHF